MQIGTWRVMGRKMAGPIQTCKQWVLLAGLWFAGPASASSVSEAFMYAGDVESALRAAASEARAAPDDVAAQERHIDVLLSLGLVDRAVDVARKRVEAAPASPDAHYLLGRAFPSADAARAAYERALKLDPAHARAHMGMGAVHTAASDAERALGAYGRAVQADPLLAEAWLGLSRAHIAKGGPARGAGGVPSRHGGRAHVARGLPDRGVARSCVGPRHRWRRRRSGPARTRACTRRWPNCSSVRAKRTPRWSRRVGRWRSIPRSPRPCGCRCSVGRSARARWTWPAGGTCSPRRRIRRVPTPGVRWSPRTRARG
jgi:hypothetical protein